MSRSRLLSIVGFLVLAWSTRTDAQSPSLGDGTPLPPPPVAYDGSSGAGPLPTFPYAIQGPPPVVDSAQLDVLDRLGRRERILAGVSAVGMATMGFGLAMTLICAPGWTSSPCGEAETMAFAGLLGLGAVGTLGGVVGGSVVGLRSSSMLEQLGRPARRALPILGLVAIIPVSPTAMLIPVAPVFIGLHGRHVRREVQLLRGSPFTTRTRTIALWPSLDTHRRVFVLSVAMAL